MSHPHRSGPQDVAELQRRLESMAERISLMAKVETALHADLREQEAESFRNWSAYVEAKRELEYERGRAPFWNGLAFGAGLALGPIVDHIGQICLAFLGLS